jgi:hypothetical protein
VEFHRESSKWILAHRGVWKHEIDQNSSKALQEAFLNGFGVETDFRDNLGSLVISHDVSIESEPFDFHFFNLSNRFAINLKSDGLLNFFVPYIEVLIESKSFVFDASIPEIVKYRKSGIPLALRLSEYEKELPWRSDYVWVDAFDSDWWMNDESIHKLMGVSHLIFVSPELHGRDYRRAYDWFVKERKKGNLDFSVCTDHPSELKSAYHE